MSRIGRSFPAIARIWNPRYYAAPPATSVVLEDHGAGSSSPGYGTPDTTGPAWTHPSGATDMTRAGGVLVAAMPSVTTRVARNALGGAITDQRVEGSFNFADWTGTSIVAYARNFLRDNGTESDCYEFRVGINVSGAVSLAIMRRVASVSTTVVSNTTALTGDVVTDFVDYKAEVEGSGASVQLRFKAWKHGTSEPGTWLIDTPDTDPARIVAAGTFAITAQVLAGYTGSFPVNASLDDIKVTDMAAVGGDANLTTTDSGSGADASAMTAASSVTESPTGSDVSAQGAIYLLTESPAGSEVSSETAAVIPTDGGSGGEATIKGFAATPETGTGADVSTQGAALALTEAPTGSEVSSQGASYVPVDSATGAEGTVTGKIATDAASGGDLSTETAAMVPTEAGVATEVSSPVAVNLVVDASAGSEAISSRDVVLAELPTGADQVGTRDMILNEAGALAAETSTVSQVANFNVSDSGLGVDASSLSIPITVTDAGSGSEVSAMTAANQRSEAGSGSEASMEGANPLDTGLGTDASQETATLVRTETGAGSDSSTVSQGVVAITVTDAAAGSESAAGITAQVQPSESPTALDGIAAKTMMSPDTASWLEVVGATAAYAAQDSSIGTDQAVAASAITLVDAGSGSEARSLSAAILRGDAGSGAEASHLTLVNVIVPGGVIGGSLTPLVTIARSRRSSPEAELVGTGPRGSTRNASPHRRT